MSLIVSPTDLDISLPSVDVDSAVASQVVSAVNAYIESQTGRCWGETKLATERANLGSAIWLRKPDVQSIVAITIGRPNQPSVTLNASSYYFSPNGRVTLYGYGPSSQALGLNNDAIQISYVYGTTDVPDDLRMAAVQLAIGMYNWTTDGGREVSSTSVGSYSVTFGKRYVSSSDTTSVNPQAVINSYKTPRF